MWTTLQGRLTIVFALVAATAWWLVRGLIEAPPTPARVRAPNHVASDISAVETDPSGRPERHLVADQLRQYVDENLTELDQPRLTLFDGEGGPPWKASSQRGLLLSGGQEVYLVDRVKIARAGSASTRSTRLETSELRIWPKLKYAQGDQPVRIESDRDWLTAAGMRLWYDHPSRAEYPGRAHIFMAPPASKTERSPETTR